VVWNTGDIKMLGDKIVVKPHHTRAAEGVYERIKDRIKGSEQRLAITVAGESGSGKSEIATELARLFKEKNGFKYIIFHQDDYFIRPPKSNDEARREDIANVGMHEVRMDLMDEHMAIAKSQEGADIKKPLIDYDNNTVLEEVVASSGVNIVLAEGTYTTALENADIRVFINRTYIDTLEHRKERARDMLDDYTEKILIIEHNIISAQKQKADVVISKDYSVE
jgi:uridine kinase